MIGRKIAVYAGFVFFLFFLFLSWRWFDPEALYEQLRALFVRPGWLLLMFAAYLLSFMLKAAAWRAYAGREHSFGIYIHGIFYSLLVNHLLPIKAGDLVRTGILMKSARLKWDDALHSVVIMRLLDLLVLGTISAAGMLWLGMAIPWFAVAGTAALIVLGGTAWTWIPIRRWSFVRRHGQRLKAVVLSRQGPIILALVTVSWILEAAILFGVARIGDIPLGVAPAVWANSVTIGGQIFHIAPGGIGTYESTLSGSLAMLGVSWKEAYTAALMTHAIKFAAAFILGAYSLFRLPIGLREARGWMRIPRKAAPNTNPACERTSV